MTQGGLRERKKERTRVALMDAAYELFDRKGFDATTIDEIAEAVEVSPRTFFRYFTSKEEVVLTLIDQQHHDVVEAVRHRPADEPVMTALGRAAVAVMREYEDGGRGMAANQFKCWEALLLSNPALAARALEFAAARLAELAQVIGARMGVDPEVDPRPFLVASVSACGVQAAVNLWREKDPTTRASEFVGRAFGLMTESLNYPAAVTR